MVAEVVRISARQPLTTAAHASLALQRVRQLHVGKTAHRALSIVTHARHATLAMSAAHVMLARRPVATSDATGAQRLLLAAVTFSATTVHLAELVKTDLHALLTVTHAHRVTRVTVAVVSKTVHNVIRTSLVQPVLSAAQPLLGTRATHAQLAKTAHHALSIAMLVLRASLKTAHRALSIATHAQHLALSIAQNHADHASSMTAHENLTATTATTAQTVVQTALTV